MSKISPRYYKLHIEPDLQNETFTGNVEIHFDIHGPADSVVLDAEDINILSCTGIDGSEQQIPMEYILADGAMKITFGKPVAKLLKLTIHYTGTLRDDLNGLYRATYKNQKGETAYMAATQFEEIEARKAFPCVDAPSYKAFFDIEILAPEGLTAVSNTPVIQIDDQDGGKKLFRFQRTPKMSTYLLYLGVGDFERFPLVGDEERERTIGRTNIPVRVLATPGKAARGEYARAHAIRALEYLGEYTGIPYPIGKMDLIALPEFAWGAMENYGAITYRENRLLVTEASSTADKAAIAAVTAHEVAHMWFGNLVSPASWKYVWLNESFASMFDDRIIDDMHPEWLVKDATIPEAAEPALRRDALDGSPALELPADDIKINLSNVNIVYSKGSRILLMLEDYMGGEGFRSVVSNFLKRYQYSSVTTSEFLSGLNDGNGDPLGKVLENWIYQSGFPIIRADRDGDKVTLSQERFFYSENTDASQWMVPITMDVYDASGIPSRLSMLLKDRQGVIDLPAGATGFIVNPDRNGYYRVAYSEACTEGLEHVLSLGGVSPLVRTGVLSDLYALAKKGERSFSDLAQFIEKRMDAETQIIPLKMLCAVLADAYRILPQQKREEIAALADNSLLPAFKKFKDLGDGAELVQKTTLSLLVATLAMVGNRTVEDWLYQSYQTLSTGGAVDGDFVPSAWRIGARREPVAAFEAMKRAMEVADSEQTKATLAGVIGSFSDPNILEGALSYTAANVAGQNRHFIFDSMGSNPDAYPFIREWLRDNIEYFDSFHSFMYERSLSGTIPYAFAENEEAALAFADKLSDGKRVECKDSVTMILDLLRTNSKFAAREA